VIVTQEHIDISAGLYKRYRRQCVCTRQFCQLTRDGEVYHDYCLNYSKAMTYLERLRKNEDFCEFEKVSAYSGLFHLDNSIIHTDGRML